eukprot:4622314-Karenia_brevis.AAC.1
MEMTSEGASVATRTLCATRCEAQTKSDWMCVPDARNLHGRYSLAPCFWFGLFHMFLMMAL